MVSTSNVDHISSYYKTDMQWLPSTQIWNQNQAELPPSFGLRIPPISDSIFPIHSGLLPPVKRKFVKAVICAVKNKGK